MLSQVKKYHQGRAQCKIRYSEYFILNLKITMRTKIMISMIMSMRTMCMMRITAVTSEPGSMHLLLYSSYLCVVSLVSSLFQSCRKYSTNICFSSS